MRLCHVKRSTLAQQPILHMTPSRNSRKRIGKDFSILLVKRRLSILNRYKNLKTRYPVPRTEFGVYAVFSKKGRLLNSPSLLSPNVKKSIS